jgi:hypothetical protein
MSSAVKMNPGKSITSISSVLVSTNQTISKELINSRAEYILLIICDLIQLIPLPSAKLSHFKLEVEVGF